MWETQAGKFTNSKKESVDFCPLDFSATNIVTCKFRVDESTNGIYDMILVIDVLAALGMDLSFSDNVMIEVKGPYEW